MADYIHDINFAETLRSAMDQFQTALTKRWREKVAETIRADEHDFPTRFNRSVSPHSSQPLWEYWRLPARHHIVNGCSFIEWAEGDQTSSLGSVSCDGETGTTEDVELVDSVNGEVVTIPPKIACGMGSILEQVEEWAFGEREHIFYQLPLFDAHDQSMLKDAYDALIRIGGKLGLEADSGSDVNYTFTPTSERDLAKKADALAGANSVGKDWWENWTGLSANQARAGFFASIVPTVNNQSQIIGCMANLYSLRSSIIEMSRNNTLHAIQRATTSLDETMEVTTSHVGKWKTLQGIGTALTINPATASVGAAVILTGFIGENLFGETKSIRYSHELEAVVSGLCDSVDDILTDISDRENEYSNHLITLRNAVYGINSFNLELYDLTENSASGDGRGEGGYTADVDTILLLGQTCMQCGEIYEELLPDIAAVSLADAHLADRDGEATSADTNLIELRTEVEGYLRTSCGRYYTAGEQTISAADAYAQTDEGSEEQFNRFMDSWESSGDTSRDYSVDAGELAEDTDRSSYDPYEGHPALGGGSPGQGQETDYETELSE